MAATKFIIILALLVPMIASAHARQLQQLVKSSKTVSGTTQASLTSSDIRGSTNASPFGIQSAGTNSNSGVFTSSDGSLVTSSNPVHGATPGPYGGSGGSGGNVFGGKRRLSGGSSLNDGVFPLP